MKILSTKDNHATVLKKGIEFILTCYGSVGYEYSYLGCTVINACKENPHSTYKFNLNPKSINEYKKIIINISKYEIKPLSPDIKLKKKYKIRKVETNKK
jgi:hypothetical protein